MDTEHVDEEFKGTAFAGRNLEGHVFEDCSFVSCDLKGVALTKARFVGCTFKSCDLSNVNLSGARLRDTTFESCKLLGIQWIRLADLVNPAFRECLLDYGNFAGLKLKKTVFFKCGMKEVDLTQAELSESDLRESDFLNARFQNTALLKADFRGAVNYLIDPISNQVRGARFALPEAQGLLAGLGVILER